MTSEATQDPQTRGYTKTPSNAAAALWNCTLWLPRKVKNYFSGKGGWFWLRVGFVAACSTAASSIAFMGAVITGREQGQLELTLFLYCSGVLVMAGSIFLMMKVIDSVRTWADPNHQEPPPRE